MKLFVAGLPYDLDDAELEEIFEKFGKVATARVAMDRDTGKSKGFGFVEMQNDVDAKNAIENLKDISGDSDKIIKTVKDKIIVEINLPKEKLNEFIRAIENLKDISLGKKPLIVKQAEDKPASGPGKKW